MIHLYMKQQFVSMQERIIIKDESGKDCYLLIGKWGNVGDGLYLYKIDGTLVAEAKQTLLSILPKFDLYLADQNVGSLSKHYGSKMPFFKVSKLHWLVTGDFYNHHYQIKKGHQLIMTMEKSYLPTGDFYALSIEDPKDAAICLCIAVILDHLLLNRLPQKVRNRRISFQPY